ncbi:hypothetical protein PIB30_053069 [Stylosanthes scabra]|uniref:Uncharacterized protein n=1 Tax=Stylosanthes scabra TaxID=79078 RepID=A0ABU6XG37_9FABA|nr:hypothetical protein [Stylosanthes scabra]
MENMMKIGNVWGKVLRIEEPEDNQYSFFRVLVDANASPLIRAWATIEIDKECFQIFVKEEGVYYPLRREDKETLVAMDYNGSKQEHEDVYKDQDCACKGMNRDGSNDNGGKMTSLESMRSVDRAVEAEESKVGENTTKARWEDEVPSLCSRDMGLIGLDYSDENMDSSSKTKTLEDDRRMEEFIRECEGEEGVSPCAQLGIHGRLNLEGATLEDEIVAQQHGDLDSSSLSMSSVFERIPLISEEVCEKQVTIAKNKRDTKQDR